MIYEIRRTFSGKPNVNAWLVFIRGRPAGLILRNSDTTLVRNAYKAFVPQPEWRLCPIVSKPEAWTFVGAFHNTVDGINHAAKFIVAHELKGRHYVPRRS